MTTPRGDVYTIEDYWTVRQRRLHSLFVHAVSVAVALAPLGSAVNDWLSGRTFANPYLAAAGVVFGVLNSAAQVYATRGVQYPSI